MPTPVVVNLDANDPFQIDGIQEEPVRLKAVYFTAFRARFPIALLNRTGSLADHCSCGGLRAVCTPRSAANFAGLLADD